MEYNKGDINMCKKTLCRLSFFLFLCLFFAVILSGCSANKNSPKSVVKRELNLIKDLDEETIESFSSYKISSENENIPDEVRESTLEAMKLFFQNFSYKIENTNVTEDQAVVTVAITNIDAQTLANDLCRAIIADSLNHPAKAEQSSVAFYSDLLIQLLTQKQYELKTTTLDIPLEKSEGIWTIISSDKLVDSLVGGLSSYMMDPNIVSAEELVEINLNHFQNMTPDQFLSYFGIDDIFSTSSSIANDIDLSFASQILNNLTFEIISSHQDDSSAEVLVDITNLDLYSVLDSYKYALLAYAETADPILATEQERNEKTAFLLLESLQDADEVTTNTISIQLKNTGLIWEIQNTAELTEAVLGNITEASSAFSEASQQTKMFSDETETEESSPQTNLENMPVIQPAA